MMGHFRNVLKIKSTRDKRKKSRSSFVTRWRHETVYEEHLALEPVGLGLG